MSVPVLDDDYFARCQRERESTAFGDSFRWHSDAMTIAYGSEERDKDDYVNGHIDVVELERRTELRWRIRNGTV